MEIDDKRKIEILNKLKVCDYHYSCSGCDYILVEDNENNRTEIKKLGLTDEIIKGYIYNGYIDLSLIAWNYTKANWWNKERGFFDQSDEQLVI